MNQPSGPDERHPFDEWITFPEGTTVLLRQVDERSTAILFRMPISLEEALSKLETELTAAGFRRIQYRGEKPGFSFESDRAVVTGVLHHPEASHTSILLQALLVDPDAKGQYGR
jgi:hypothetical protein